MLGQLKSCFFLVLKITLNQKSIEKWSESSSDNTLANEGGKFFKGPGQAEFQMLKFFFFFLKLCQQVDITNWSTKW